MKAFKSKIYVNAIGVINALGNNAQQVFSNLSQGRSPGMQSYQAELLDKTYFCGVVEQSLPKINDALAKFNCRNNQLALAALQQIQSDIEQAIERFGAARVGVVMGTSTSGIKEAEVALKIESLEQTLPADFDYKMQEIGALSEFVGLHTGVKGPCYAISTACSSSGKVFAAATRLLETQICDAVIVGGADSLCDLTLGGFESLEAISAERTNPFSINRRGINIGEGAAVFLLTREPLVSSAASQKIPGDKLPAKPAILLLGVGESSDAHHMSAPEPNGAGAIAAMRSALQQANLQPKDINYLNLHGTGTRLNDSMEAHAVNLVFGSALACSSTKPLTGHTLGAAGATEAAICCLILQNSGKKVRPSHLFDGQLDPDLSKIALVDQVIGEQPVCITMSNSFAFGGNNVSVIFAIE